MDERIYIPMPTNWSQSLGWSSYRKEFAPSANSFCNSAIVKPLEEVEEISPTSPVFSSQCFKLCMGEV